MVITLLPACFPEPELQAVTYRAPCPHLGTIAMFFLLVLPSWMVTQEHTSGCLYLLAILLGGHEPMGVHCQPPAPKATAGKRSNGCEDSWMHEAGEGNTRTLRTVETTQTRSSLSEPINSPSATSLSVSLAMHPADRGSLKTRTCRTHEFMSLPAPASHYNLTNQKERREKGEERARSPEFGEVRHFSHDLLQSSQIPEGFRCDH